MGNNATLEQQHNGINWYLACGLVLLAIGFYVGIGVGAPVSVAAGGSVEIGAGTGACFGVIPGLALTAYGVKTALKKYLI